MRILVKRMEADSSMRSNWTRHKDRTNIGCKWLPQSLDACPSPRPMIMEEPKGNRAKQRDKGASWTKIISLLFLCLSILNQTRLPCLVLSIALLQWVVCSTIPLVWSQSITNEGKTLLAAAAAAIGAKNTHQQPVRYNPSSNCSIIKILLLYLQGASLSSLYPREKTFSTQQTSMLG